MILGMHHNQVNRHFAYPLIESDQPGLNNMGLAGGLARRGHERIRLLPVSAAGGLDGAHGVGTGFPGVDQQIHYRLFKVFIHPFAPIGMPKYEFSSYWNSNIDL